MDSVSQSTEGTQDGNNKNVESKTDEQNDNITTQEIAQSSEPTNDCPIKNSTASDTSPTTSATKTSSSTAPVVESTPNKSSDPQSSNVDECSSSSSKGTNNNNTFISDTSQDQTSQSKTEADTKAPPPQPPHVIPEVTLIGKFEIAPISTSSSSSSSSSSSLKLECLQTTTATITTTAPASSSISFNNNNNSSSSSRSHSKENEKFGTTTFEVNKVRDDSLKIATKAPTQATALGGIFSSTSSQQSSSCSSSTQVLSRGETDATTMTVPTTAAATTTSSSSGAAAMCNRVSSENESINQNENQNHSSRSSNQEIIESSSNNSNTTSSTTDDDNKHRNYVTRETCIENRIQNTDCNLEKDFILDSKKLSKDISVEQKIDECSSNARAAAVGGGSGGGGQQPSTNNNNNNNNINNSNKNIDDENSEKIKINSAGAENKSSSCNYFFNEALGKISDSNTTTTNTIQTATTKTTTTDLSNIIKPIKNIDKMECDTGCKNNIITENIENNIIIDRIDKNILSYKKFTDKILNKTNVEHHVMTSSSSDMSSSSRQLNLAAAATTTKTATIITKAANAAIATATATAAATTTNVSDNEITTNNAREDKKFTSNNAQSMNDDNNVVSSSNISSNNNFDMQLTNFDDINIARKLDDNVPESTISRCIPNETSQEMSRNKSININNNNRMDCLSSSLTGQTSSSNYQQEINSRLSHPNIQIQSLPQVRSSPIEQIANKEPSSSSTSTTSISAAATSFRNQTKIETYPQTSKEMVASKIRHYYDQKFSPAAVSSNSSDRSNIITKNDKNAISDTTTTQKVAQQQPVINSYYDCNREATQSTTYDRSHQYYHQQQQQQQQQQQHQQSTTATTTTNNNRTPLRESESTVVSSNQQYNPHYYNREANTVTQQPENNRYNSWQASERQLGYQNQQQQQHSQDVNNYLNQSRSTLTNNYSNTMSKQQVMPTTTKLQDNIKNLPSTQQTPSQSELLLTNNNNNTNKGRNSTTSVSSAAGNNQQYFQQYPRSTTTTDTYQIKEMEYQRQMVYNHNYNYNLNQPQQRSTITTSSSSNNQSTTNQQQQQQQTNQHNNSLYINNPDFSKQISQKSRIPSSSSSVNNNNNNNSNNNNNNNNDLSQLHMKPPDFSKISSTDKVSSPQNQVYPRSIKNDYPKQNLPQITQQNFAELSKKYNYISDLQLKNPVPPDASKQPYNNLYVKAPDFSAENFQNQKVSSEAKNLQIKQQQQQQIPQNQQQQLHQQQQQQFIQRTSEAASVRNESSYARQFPQLSHDVELSVVPPKPTSSYPDNTKNPYERQMSYADYLQYNKSAAHTVVEPQNKSVDRNLKIVSTPEQQQQPKPDPYYQARNEYQQTAYPAQVTSREQYQQIPGQQMYGSNLKIQPSNEMNPAAQGYASIRYEQKTQQQQQQQQQPTHPAEPYSSYNYQQVSSSVIQSSKPRDRYPEYSPPAGSQNQIKPNESPLTSMQRQIPNNLNYHHVPQQPAQSHMTSNQASKIPSPSPMTHSRGGGYPAQQNQSNSNPPSPACPTTYKTTPSPGTMNPPYGWPSQSNGNRISQSPVASPHAPYRITSQSPSALNAVSPQSPTFLQPSPKASPSPTLLSRPTPQAAPNMHVNYKTPYGHPGSSPYYQPNEHTMRVPNNYGPKIEKPVEKAQPAETPVTHYRNVDTRQTEYANVAAYQQKSSTSKRNYVDYSPNPQKQPKTTSKYPEISPPKQDYPVLFGKSPSESNLSKSHQKPNYREMINHVHAIRSATSETDLNVEIIKRTLKKDISARRSDSDLSKSIFDSPVPTKNCGYYARSTECIPGLRAQYEETKRMEASTAGFDASRRQSQPDLLKTRVPERKPSLPLCNDLARNDISVTVSKVIRSTSAERQKPPDRPTQSMPEAYPQHSEFSSVVISKVNYNHSVEQQQMPPSLRSVEARPVPQQTVIETNKPSSSVFNPVKRESPLDLSVKTVKTKADSTGCDDVNSYHARNHPSSSALKVDFAPNFSKHSSGEASTRTSQQHPTQAATFDARYQNTVQHVQQPQTQRYTSVSQSRPFQPPAHQMPPATQQYLQHAPYHAGSPHHQVSPQSHIQPSPSARPDAAYPTPILPREPSSYGYEHHVSQPHAVHLEHRSSRPQEYVQPPQATKPKYEYPPKPQDEAGYQPPSVGANIFGQSSKQNTYVNPYLPPKREPEAAKQNVILNPPTPMTVYDKKSDDYLMNTPQRQRKISDKAKEPEPLKIPNPAETHKIQQYSTRQDSVLRYDAYDSRKKPESAPIPNPSQSNAINQRLASSSTVKALPDANINYNRPGYGVNERIRDEFSRPIEVQKRNETSFIPDSYGHYVNTTLESRKVAQPMNKINQTYERIEPDKHRNSEYHRKRPPEVTPPSSKDYQPAEKQVRVDELYRAHLEEKYRQHQQFTQKVNVPQPLERRDVSVIHTKIEAIGKNDPKTQEQYPYAYKDNYQQHPVHNSVNYQTYSQQQQQTWRPPGHVKPIPSPHEAAKTVQRELYPHLQQQHYIGPQKSEIERLKSLEAKKQAAIPAEATPKILPTSTQTQPPPPVNRGADQNVISKLRNSIEMREYEKQRTSLLRKQANGELGEDEAGKPDIASLLAARIRTKGELKGFTPLPIPAAPEIKEPEKEAAPPREIPESTERGGDLFSDADGNSPFDLLDWGSACNDFVEQLLTGGSKKRGKKRRATKTAPDPQEASRDKSPENFPGVEYNCDIDKSIVEQLKSEISENAVNAANAKKQEQEEAKNRDCSSSDEDKPLLLLRQQSQSDTVPPLTSDADRSAQPVSESKRENSDTSLNSKSNRSTIVEKLSEKVVRNIREKQRLEQERRLAARLSKTSSSESEDDSKRTLYRPKKLTKKPRSRASGASNRELSDTDSSENRSMTRNLFRSRIESRNHKRIENFFTDSDSSTNLNQHAKKQERDDIQKIVNSLGTDSPLPTKREMITKAKVKCMKLPTESSESSEDEKVLAKSTPVKSTKEESKRTPEKATNAQKDGGSDGEDASMDQEKTTPSPNKARNKRTASTRQSQDSKIEETMTRSKRKKRLEQQIANGKVLRNEKIIQNTSFDRKATKPAEKTSSKHSKTSESTAGKSADEKTKLLVARIKIDKIDDPKRKHSGNDSDDKRKKQAKFVKDESSDNNSSDTEEKETVSDRLRSRRSRLSNERHDTEAVTKSTKKHKSKEKQPKEEFEVKKATSTAKSTSTKKSKSKLPPTTETNTEKFPPGWELEVYQYKRALKIPPSLISIKGPIHHRVSTSLPDLDPHSSDTSETFQGDSTKKTPCKSDATEAGKPSTKASKKSKQTKETEVECKTTEKLTEDTVPKSIIDVLHSRLKSKKVKNKNSRFASHNEPKLLPRGSNEAELLATPGKDDKPPFEEHHNVFHTEVLKSRTRTEYRILKNKELIREVFGGEDRPASAPPEIRDEVENDTKVEQITFVEKYDKYLQEMNVDFGEKIRKNRKPPNEDNNKIPSDPMAITIKTEKPDEEPMFPVDEETQDNEIKACLQTIIKEETQDTNERDTPSIISEREGVVTPLIFKRKKCNKYRGGRRKGSSGFDYIRKKKKPQTNTNNSQDIIKRKKNSPIEFFNSRDESDVSKEIQKWVLNKSVGQSALHKAARLGYLDVIAYCLERLGMNPDAKDNAGYTPLHEACAKGRIDIARVLLQYGANHSETAHSGIRPLHEASENGYIEVVRLLLSYGADPLLTTYSGQTPLMLAENAEMEQFIKNHLQDVQNTGPHKQPWKFPGPWKILDPDDYGYDVLSNTPETDDDDQEDSYSYSCSKSITSNNITDKSRSNEKCDTNSNIMHHDDKATSKSLQNPDVVDNIKYKTKGKQQFSAKCTVLLDNIGSIDHINSVKQFKNAQSKGIARRRSTFERKDSKAGRYLEESDGDGEIFEFEESDMPLPPLYLLKDEGTDKWVLLNDLCNILKVKSKDTLLKQLCPSIPPSTVNKELLRELKMSDFLEKATCLQLLCAGEKLNVRSSKVVLVKYNESVKNLLGVKTIVMKF